MERNKFSVCVRCFTYNQVSYIIDALDGFVSQKTDFPFLCVIVDDCSTDGEQEILKDYLERNFNMYEKGVARKEETKDYILVQARHLINHHCFFAVVFLKYNHYKIKKSKKPYIQEYLGLAEYSALCEGDDYWTDSSKLQRQYTFLQLSPEYIAVTENGEILFLNTNSKRLFSEEKERDVTIREMIDHRCFPTASIMYRTKVLDEGYDRLRFKQDTSQWCYMATKGKIRYFENVSSVYRLGDGVSLGRVDPYIWAKRVEEWDREFLKLYPDSFDLKTLRRRKYSNCEQAIVYYATNRGKHENLYNALIECIRLHPLKVLFRIPLKIVREFYRKYRKL